MDHRITLIINEQIVWRETLRSSEGEIGGTYLHACDCHLFGTSFKLVISKHCTLESMKVWALITDVRKFCNYFWVQVLL